MTQDKNQDKTQKNKEHNEHHIVSYKENFSTWIALIILTVLTVAISIFSAKLISLSVFTALAIASVKALVVAYFFMHLKYDKKIYTRMVWIVVVLFGVFMTLTIIDYLTR